jgi:hypothetical protein
MRDWQNRTLQWLAGKMFERSTPVGPYLVTGDEVGDAADLEVRCEVDGTVMQQSRTSDLLFGPAEIAAYASQAITLLPGDLLLTGTPGGVGNARKPPVYLQPGQTLRTVIEGLGECVNQCVNQCVVSGLLHAQVRDHGRAGQRQELAGVVAGPGPGSGAHQRGRHLPLERAAAHQDGRRRAADHGRR